MAWLPPRLLARLVLYTQLPGLALLVALGLVRYQEERTHAAEQLRWHAQALSAALGDLDRLDDASLHALLAQRQLPPQWVAGIGQGNGLVAAHGGGIAPVDLPQGMRNVAADDAGVPMLTELRTSGGRTIVAAVVPARVPGWTAVVGMPRDVLRASLWRPVARDLLPVLALLLVVLALSVQLARRSRDHAQLRTELQRVNRTFERELLRESESRQQAIARDLHDAIGSALAGIGMLLGSARSFAREPEAVALIGKSQEQVQRATREIRRILRGMMPAGQDRGALLPALEQFAAEMDETRTVHCTVSARGDFTSVPAEVGGHLFRIVQEATANALRHGRARHVRIRLAQAGGCCRLTVRDDGRGCDPELLSRPAPGIGMRSMLARAEAIRGHLDVVAWPGRGLRVRVTWPAEAPAAGAP